MLGVNHKVRLFALNDLSQLGSHRSDARRERKLREAVKTFSTDAGAYRGGWGKALHAVYDGVGENIEEAIAAGVNAALQRSPMQQMYCPSTILVLGN